jgi:ribosome-associated toxin RatA of RatAB toxin-antitoxin module
MISGSRSTDVAASPEAVFAVASDLERYPEWQNFLQAVRVRERDADGAPTLVEAQADAKVTSLKLVLRATRDAPQQVAWRSEGGDVKALAGAFDIAELGARRSAVTFRLDVEPGFKLGLLLRGGVGDKLRDRILGGMLDGLRRRAEGG